MGRSGRLGGQFPVGPELLTRGSVCPLSVCGWTSEVPLILWHSGGVKMGGRVYAWFASNSQRDLVPREDIHYNLSSAALMCVARAEL